MKKACLIAIVSIFILIFAKIASSVDIMSFSDIRPGMKGYGLTVYRGTVPEKFEFEVLGVKDKWITTSNSPVILVRLFGGPADFPVEKTGVVAGMSGSPMYINGKLIGALAYGFGVLPKDAIAGVQPAESMLDPYNKVKKGKKMANGFSHIPLVFSVPESHAEFLNNLDRFKNDEFLKENLIIVPMSSMSEEDSGDTKFLKFEAGSSLNVYLIKGDINYAANGTVTMVDGNTIYAFGHPFLGFGETEMYFHQAEVITILSDYGDSYKMAGGEAGKAEGVIVDDYYSAIKGVLGPASVMTAMRIEMSGPIGSRDVNFKVARLPIYTVKLINLATASVIYQDGYAEVSDMLNGTKQEMAVETIIKINGLKSIGYKETYNFEFYNTKFSEDLSRQVEDYCDNLSKILTELEKKGLLRKISAIGIDIYFDKAKEKKDSGENKSAEMKEAKVNSHLAFPSTLIKVDLEIATESKNKKEIYQLPLPLLIPGDAAIGSDMRVTIGNGRDIFNSRDIKEFGPEETVDYFNKIFDDGGLFVKIEYEAEKELGEEGEDKDQGFKIDNLDLGLWRKKGKAVTTKRMFYKIPLPANVDIVKGAEVVYLVIQKPAESKDKPINDGSGAESVMSIFKWFFSFLSK